MTNLSIPKTVHNKKLPNIWYTYVLPIGVPILLGVALGPLLALSIVNSNMVFTIAISLLIPLVIVVIRYPFAAIMIWLIVMPWFPLEGRYRYVYFSVHYTLIPLALVLAILSRVLRLKEYPPLQIRLPELAPIAFGAIAIIWIIISGHKWQLILTLHARFLVPFIAYWLVRVMGAREQELKRLLPLIFVIFLAQCVIGLLSWFTPEVLPAIWHKRLLGSRVSGTFDGAGPYGLVLIFFMVLLYHEAMNRKRDQIQTSLILAFGLGMICIFFTFTRAVWGASLIALLGLLYLYPKPTSYLVGVAMFIMFILSFNVLSSEFHYASYRLSNSDETAKARVVLANAGEKMFYARPIFGWGFGNYDDYDWKFMERVQETTPTKWQIQKGTSHHTYLTILAEMGAVGLFLYMVPIVWWLIRSVKTLSYLPQEGFWNQRLLILMWLPIAVQIIIGQTSDFRYAMYAVTLYWINLGFIANIIQSSLEPKHRQAS